MTSILGRLTTLRMTTFLGWLTTLSHLNVLCCSQPAACLQRAQGLPDKVDAGLSGQHQPGADLLTEGDRFAHVAQRRRLGARLLTAC